jgi:hypothetical protein
VICGQCKGDLRHTGFTGCPPCRNDNPALRRSGYIGREVRNAIREDPVYCQFNGSGLHHQPGVSSADAVTRHELTMAHPGVDRLGGVETTLTRQLPCTRGAVESNQGGVVQLQELPNQNRDERVAGRAKHVADRAKLAHQLARSEGEVRLLQQAVDEFDENRCVQDAYLGRGGAEAANARAAKNEEENTVLTRENLRFNRGSQRTKRGNRGMRANIRHTRATLPFEPRSALKWRPVRPICHETRGKWVHTGETQTLQPVVAVRGAVSHDFALDHERHKYAVATANECRKRNEDNGWSSVTSGES